MRGVVVPVARTWGLVLIVPLAPAVTTATACVGAGRLASAADRDAGGVAFAAAVNRGDRFAVKGHHLPRGHFSDSQRALANTAPATAQPHSRQRPAGASKRGQARHRARRRPYSSPGTRRSPSAAWRAAAPANV